MTSDVRAIRDDDIIDLRATILTLLRFWPLLLIMTLLAAGVAWVLSAGGKPIYEARIGLIVTNIRTEAVLEPRIRTVMTEDETALRQVLAGLIKNATVAERVIAALGATLPEELRNVADLTRLVSGQVAPRGLIEIAVRHSDPLLAAEVANAWGREYERYVNELYNEPAVNAADIAAQVQRTAAEYAAAQQALNDFAASSRVAELTRLIGEKQATVNTLQAAKQGALTTIISDTLNARVQIVQTYLEAQSQNARLAFAKDRQARLDMYSRLTVAELQALGTVFDRQFNAQLNRLGAYYNEQARLEGLLGHAHALESQIAAAGDAAAPSNTLAILLLKAQVFAASDALPTNLQLSVDAAGASASAESQRRDVAALIGVIEARLQQLDADIQAQLAALLAGEDLTFLDELSAANLTSASLLTGTLSADAPQTEGAGTLADAVLQSYRDMLSLGTLAQAGLSGDAEAPLVAALTQLYPQLFDMEALLPLIGRGGDASLDDAFNQVVEGLEDEVRQLAGQLEQEQARQRELTSARDRAWEAYDAVARKAAEVDISASSANTVARFAAPAVPPDRPLSSRRLLYTAVAGGLGFLLAVGLALMVNYLNPPFARRLTRPA